MIEIKIQDTLVDVVEKIESHKKWDIILDFPLWHPILHNYVSLKVLKSKAKKKRLVIATNDKVWRKIGKNLWIEYSLVKNRDFIEENTQAHLIKHNYSFWEYFKFQLRTYGKDIKSSIEANKKFNSLWRYSRMYGEKSSLHIFIMAFAWALLLFIFIYYFAVSRTYIIITPERTIKKMAQNFVFKENIENNILWNNKYIKINTISQKIQSSETYAGTEIQSSDNNKATGKVVLYNEFSETQDLIAGTRLQDSQGIIFEISSWIQIPGGVEDNFWNISPGEIEISVQAQEKDITGQLIGKRGNIPEWTSFILPALDIQSQKKIYARSIENFTWWNNSYKKIISQNDIENARKLFEEKLKSESLKSLKNTISKNNKENKTSFDILSWGRSIIYWDPEVLLEEGINPGVVQETFTVSGSITIIAYVYNKNNVIQRLKTLVGERTLEWVEKIARVDDNSLRMSQIIYLKEAEENDPINSEDDQEFELKATFEIDSTYIHDFLHVENGYIDLLRAKIRWKPKDEAQKILLNDPKVSNARIEIRPFFVKSISNISSNIIFEIE